MMSDKPSPQNNEIPEADIQSPFIEMIKGRLRSVCLRDLFNLGLLLLFAAMALSGCKSAQPDGDTPTSPTDNGDPVITAMPTVEPVDIGGGDVESDDSVVISIDLGMRPQTLAPMRVAPLDSAAGDLVENLFVGLTHLDADTGEISPALASHWETPDGGKTWQVFLRDDITWTRINSETGEIEALRPITATDVVFSVQRVCREGNTLPLAKSAFLIEGCQTIAETDPALLTDEEVAQRVGVRVLNDVVVEFHLVESIGLFPSVMAMPILRPVPADLIAEIGDSWWEPDTIWTSGPYTIQPTIPADEGYTLVANPFWLAEWTGNVDVVQVSFSDGTRAGYAAWEDGQVDLSVIPIPELINTDFTDPRFIRHAQPATTFIAFSYSTLPFDSGDLRRAFSMALAREKVVSLLASEGEAGLPAYTLSPPGTALAPEYGSIGAGTNPDSARAAIAAAGYPGCNGLPPITLLTDDSDLSLTLAETYVQSWIDVLGCSSDTFIIESEPYASLLVALSSGRENRPALITLGWQADIYDSQHWLADILGCRTTFPDSYLNQGRACITADDDLLRAATTDDLTRQAALYITINEALFGIDGEFPLIPVYHYARPIALQGGLTIYPSVGGAFQFDRWVVEE